MLSMLLPSETREGVAGTDAPRICMMPLFELPFLRAETRPRGDSGKAGRSLRPGVPLLGILFKRRELEPFRTSPNKVGVGGVLGVRDDPERDDADDGGRARPERTEPEPDMGGVEVLLSFEALVEAVRTDDGDPFGWGRPLSFPFLSGVAGLTLIAEVKLTFNAPG